MTPGKNAGAGAGKQPIRSVQAGFFSCSAISFTALTSLDKARRVPDDAATGGVARKSLYDAHESICQRRLLLKRGDGTADGGLRRSRIAVCGLGKIRRTPVRQAERSLG